MPRYSIRSCSTNATANGHSNSFRQTGLVYKVNGACWEILSTIQGSTAQPGDISLDNIENSYSGTSACSDCTFSLNPRYNCVNGQCVQATNGTYGSLAACQSNCNQSTTAWVYQIIDCNGLIAGSVFHNSNGGLNNRGIIISNQCYRLSTPFQTNPPSNALNITNYTTYDNACPCQNNPAPGSGTTGVPTKYLFQQCSGTATVIGFRNQGDLTIGGSITINGQCYRVTSIFGNMDNPGNNYSNASICSCPGVIGGGGGSTGGGTGGGTFTGIGGGQGVNTGAGGGQGLLIGYMCTQQGCQIQYYDPAAGQEPQYFTLQECQTQCQAVGPNGTTGVNLVVGYICTNNGCSQIYYDPNTGQEAYSTLVACQNACTGGPQPPGPNGPTEPVLTVFPELVTGDGDESNPPGNGGPTPIDPCSEEFEPTEGQLLRLVTPIVVGGKESSQPGAVLDPDFYEYLIPECWRWKYKVCAKRPAGSQLGTPWRMEVCLRNLAEPPEWPYPMPGTFIRFECKAKDEPNIGPNAPKFEKWAVYHDGYGGTYSMFIESNSIYCGYTPTPGCASSGILINTYCIGVDQYGEYHDGKCGTYTQKIATNSKICGYKDPPPPPPAPTEDNTIKEIKTVAQAAPGVNVAVYVPISKEDKLDGIDINSYPLWSGNDSYLRNYYTSSLTDSSSLDYILNVYDKPLTSTTCSVELQYKIIYADYEGKGATDLGGLDSETLTKAMYTQYVHALLPHGETKFNFNGTDEDYVYIIDVSRSRFKQSMDPGNWQLTISSCSFTLNTGSNSVLSDMFTTSYGNASLTLIDNATKQITERGPIYITSKNYDVQIGTIEDGLYTTYISSSIASSSLIRTDVTHIVPGTSGGSNTAIVTGAEALPFVFTNATGSFFLTRNYQDTYNSETNTYEIGYSGNWTGSFTSSLGGVPFVPNIISGSLNGVWYTSYSNPLGNGKLKLGTFFAKPISYTTGSRTYNGFLKWGFNTNEGGVYECPNCQEFFVTASQNQLNVSGSISGPSFGYLMADSWGGTTIISTSSYTELTNGNILYPVRSDVFGRFYPNHGIIVLSGRKMDELGFNTNRSIDKHGYNTYRLFHAMELVLNQGLTDSSGDPLGFYGRSVDINYTTRCFVTLKTGHLNFSNNPTYTSGSEGEIIESFINQQKSYFTSIGLYNADKELLAIGKVSKPIMSSMTDESLFTVKVTY